jgi:hypothetical protein
VILFDPKYAASTFMDEYLEMLEPRKDRTILKFSGDGTWLFNAWKSRGFPPGPYGYQAWKTGSPTLGPPS